MTRVLVVDDEPAMQRTMRIYLTAQGYDVDLASHGTAALKIAARKNPDAVLLDLGLPDLDGVDVIRGLRVTVHGTEVRLTPTEWRMLEVLVRNAGRLVSQRQLLTEVRGPAYDHETNYLRVYLAQLRRKLEPDPTRPRHLITEPGMGYRFEP